MKILVLLIVFYIGFVAGANWRYIHRGDQDE